jgi:hypothetical protein
LMNSSTVFHYFRNHKASATGMTTFLRITEI